MVLGTEGELKERYEMQMQRIEHAEVNAITLDDGKSGVLIWQFTKSGTVPSACLLPGHYDAGMRARMKVIQKIGMTIYMAAMLGLVGVAAHAQAAQGSEEKSISIASTECMSEGELKKSDASAGKLTRACEAGDSEQRIC